MVQLDNFRKLSLFGCTKHNKMNFLRHYEDQKACAFAYLQANPSCSSAPMPLVEILEVDRVSTEVSLNC